MFLATARTLDAMSYRRFHYVPHNSYVKAKTISAGATDENGRSDRPEQRIATFCETSVFLLTLALTSTIRVVRIRRLNPL